MDSVIEVRDLTRRYGDVVALAGVSFAVPAGGIFGYLGPNGAGKTTTINILGGLLRRHGGQVRVCGSDIERDPVGVKQRIGVVGEESNLYPELTCRRNLDYLGQLYGLARRVRRQRAGELLEAFDLADKADAPFRSLSRGMKRRLTVAASLLHRPAVLFLDEPTAGLDVPSARALRSMIRDVSAGGVTVFLTTHNLSEAEALCHRILILAKGRVVTEGTALEIRQRVPQVQVVSVRFSAGVSGDQLRGACPAARGAAGEAETWRVESADAHAAVEQLAAFAGQAGVRIVEIGTAGGSLEDAFMAIVDGGGVGREGRA